MKTKNTRAIINKIGVALLTMLVFTGSVFSQETKKEDEFKPSGKIWGYTFGDVFIKVGGDTLYFGRSEYASAEKNTMGGKLRRIYFGYDFKISPKWSTRFLLEGNTSVTTQGGNFGVAIKLGYLEYKGLFKKYPNSAVKVGLIPTPVFAFPEKTWGYRSIEKEALDLRGFGSSVDQGASFEMNFDNKNNSGFTVMIGNGTGNKPTVRKYLEYYLSYYQKFLDNKFSIELMTDYRDDEELERILTRVFLSYELPKFRVGAEISPNFVKQKLKVDGEKEIVTTKPLLTSFFLAPRLHEKIWFIARYDYFNPDMTYKEDYEYIAPSENYDEHLVITGLEFILHEKVKMTPNLYVNIYKKKQSAVLDRKADIVLRTTVYYNF